MIFVEKGDVAGRLLTPSPAALEVVPGLWAVRVLSRLEAVALVLQAEQSPFWSPAVINSDASVDPATRMAEVLAEELVGLRSGAYGERLAWSTGELARLHAPGSTLSEVQLVRYTSGGKYVDHRDVVPEGESQRLLSIVLYLNESGVGGETVFPELGVAIPPMSGIAIVFLPGLLHRADPLTSGVKHVVTAWYH